MTFRARPVTKRKRRTHWENEQRTEFWVTLGFLALAALTLLILGGAVAVGYYNDHFKAVARVDGREINRDQWLERQKVARFRLDKAESRIRERLAAGTLDSSEAQQQLSELETQRQSVATQALDDLIDQVLQTQIGSKLGVGVGAAEIDTALKKEATVPEERKVLAIFVEPEAGASNPGGTPDARQKAAARQRAEKALAELKAGKAFAEVAKRYSSDASRDRGGEYGFIDAENPTDGRWVEAVFKLPLNGTTGVIEGSDGTYRIGRVTEIRPGSEDQGFTTEVEREVGLAAYRSALEGDLIEKKLRDKVTRDATTGAVDQARAAEIVILTPADAQGQPATGPEVKTSHILYSPKDDPGKAEQVKPDDPAWAAAKRQADAAARRLRAIASVPARERQFAQIARAESDDKGSGQKGGDLGFFGQGAVVQEFGTAIFGGTHRRGDIIGPVKTQFGWHVILYVEKRASPEERIQEVARLVKRPGADFAAIARQRSEGETAARGGDLGWIARYQREKQVDDVLFKLQPGQVSDPVKLEDGFHVYKVAERAKRPVDAQQRSEIEAHAFEAWYQPQKDGANVWRDEQAISSGAEASPATQ
jgi:parvulin-like peptidyl-prolyl isomerase